MRRHNFQELPSAFEAGLHVHSFKLGNRHFEMLECRGGVPVLYEQLGETELYDGNFGTKTDLPSGLQGQHVISARCHAVAGERRGISQMACDAREEKYPDRQLSDTCESCRQSLGR